jgi:hypothetical protein
MRVTPSEMADNKDMTPVPGSRRGGTILRRLANAVREQNWFAVVLELLIVVAGVVIGFQVTAWGQERYDIAKEQAHLRQLAADLIETANETNRIDSLLFGPDHAGGQMWAAFYSVDPPPPDSIFAWRALMVWNELARPVLGTAEALVATGDLALIRDDSLRSAILTYIAKTNDELHEQDEQQRIWWNGVDQLDRGLDLVEAYHESVGQETFESYVRGSPSYPPMGSTQIRFPLDTEVFFSDRELLSAVWRMTRSKDELRNSRARMREDAITLLRRVEGEK